MAIQTGSKDLMLIQISNKLKNEILLFSQINIKNILKIVLHLL